MRSQMGCLRNHTRISRRVISVSTIANICSWPGIICRRSIPFHIFRSFWVFWLGFFIDLLGVFLGVFLMVCITPSAPT